MNPIVLVISAAVGAVAGFLLAGLGYQHNNSTKEVKEDFDIGKAQRATIMGAVGGFLIIAFSSLFGFDLTAGSMQTYFIAGLGGLFGDEVIRKVIESFRQQAFGEK